MESDPMLIETLKVLKIFQNSNFSKTEKDLTVFKSDKMDSSESFDLTEATAFNSNSELISRLEEDVAAILQSNYLEFQKSATGIETILQMYKHCLEKTDDFQHLNPPWFEDHFADIINPSKIGIKVEEMKTFISHIKTIVAESKKLDQIFRLQALNDTWAMKREYHRTVINFFSIAFGLVKSAEEVINFFESKKEYTPDSLQTLQINGRKFRAVLHNCLDCVTEFRNYVQLYHNTYSLRSN